ncbi:MAG: sulfatase-like hydrolase/transferase [candidate division KSB1 bacterium]|nr:sulfatase-like hydrolase/transferase [candidate division KSB1 bacterium]
MNNRRSFLKSLGALTVLSALPLKAGTKKPNILWLSTEDISPHLGCYGYPHAHTPTLDQMAANGIRYSNAFTVSGVCAPNRSTIITGVHANSLGTHHMRSGGEGVEVSHEPPVPNEVRCFSEYLRDAGYYCTNYYKTDYNFDPPDSAWDECSHEAHWKNRPDANMPFFAVFNYTYTHEGSTRFEPGRHQEVTARLTPEQRQGDGFQLDSFPPYYADTRLQRRQWAKYYELITGLDYWIAERLQELEDAGLYDDTIVFFWSDHGVGMPRAKRWLYDSGTHIPLIVHIPEQYGAGAQGSPEA